MSTGMGERRCLRVRSTHDNRQSRLPPWHAEPRAHNTRCIANYVDSHARDGCATTNQLPNGRQCREMPEAGCASGQTPEEVDERCLATQWELQANKVGKKAGSIEEDEVHITGKSHIVDNKQFGKQERRHKPGRNLHRQKGLWMSP